MNLQGQKRIVGIIHIIYGLITIIFFLLIGAFFDAFFPFILEAIEEDSGKEAANIVKAVKDLIRSVFYILLAFCTLPSIIGGIGLLQKKSWGMTVSLIAGCIAVFSFPIGTAIGGYTIFVFIQDNKNKNDEAEG
ncbi:MAG: hypothetical protein AB8B73_10385 [Ekhidna sp.]